jgi:hypothetical protein
MEEFFMVSNVMQTVLHHAPAIFGNIHATLQNIRNGHMEQCNASHVAS